MLDRHLHHLPPTPAQRVTLKAKIETDLTESYYTTGDRIWDADIYLPSGTDSASFVQILRGVHPSGTPATDIMLNVYDTGGGTVRRYDGTVLRTGAYDSWFNVKIAHQATSGAGTVKVYLDDSLVLTVADQGPATRYFKNGVYNHGSGRRRPASATSGTGHADRGAGWAWSRRVERSAAGILVSTEAGRARLVEALSRSRCVDPSFTQWVRVATIGSRRTWSPSMSSRRDSRPRGSSRSPWLPLTLLRANFSCRSQPLCHRTEGTSARLTRTGFGQDRRRA
ncbi:hypothetical protein AB0D34_42045 [Streptomyces sp. NPDC048420]|uniref:hypothetical protein n=1 Tax=Streptomyces sp. NPDC048420 TaxID=3155755 RepID=UPI00343A99DE